MALSWVGSASTRKKWLVLSVGLFALLQLWWLRPSVHDGEILTPKIANGDDGQKVGEEEREQDTNTEKAMVRTKETKMNCDCALANKAAEFSERLEKCNVEVFNLHSRVDGQRLGGEAPKEEDSKFISVERSECSIFNTEIVEGMRVSFSITAKSNSGENLTTVIPFFWGALRRQDDSVADSSDTSAFAIPIRIEPASGEHPELYFGSFLASNPGKYFLLVENLGRSICTEKITITPANNQEEPKKKLPMCESIHLFGSGVWKTKTKWEPKRCHVPAHPRSAVKEKNIFFIGDSLVRCIFWQYSWWMKNAPALTHFNGYKLSLYEEKGPDINSSARFQILWRRNKFGSIVMDTMSVLDILNSLKASRVDINQYNWFVIGVGAHDLARADTLHEMYVRFEENLHKILHKLLFEMNYMGKVLWINETPSVPQKLNAGVLKAYKTFQMESKVRKLNKIAEKVLSIYGIPVLDAFSIALPRPELTYDGQHYVRSGNVTKDYVYANIVEALVHFAFRH